VRFLTSEPQDGSVTARHILFWPPSISGIILTIYQFETQVSEYIVILTSLVTWEKRIVSKVVRH
jgi:hypothetical protein